MTQCIIFSSTEWVFPAPVPVVVVVPQLPQLPQLPPQNPDDGTPLGVPPVELRDNIDTWHLNELLR